MLARGIKILDTVQKEIDSPYSSDSDCDDLFSDREPEKTFEGAHGFGKGLEKKGFKRLGSGYYSTVYAKEGSNRVIKVSRQQDNWIDYAFWAAKEGWAGTYAPKVYSYKKFTSSKSPFEVAVVERMEKTFSEVRYKDDPMCMKVLADMAMHGNKKATSIVETMAPGISTFVERLHERYKHCMDTHSGNIMLRSNGTICWTDPITQGEPVTFTRLRSHEFSSLH